MQGHLCSTVATNNMLLASPGAVHALQNTPDSACWVRRAREAAIRRFEAAMAAIGGSPLFQLCTIDPPALPPSVGPLEYVEVAAATQQALQGVEAALQGDAAAAAPMQGASCLLPFCALPLALRVSSLESASAAEVANSARLVDLAAARCCRPSLQL